MGYKISFDASIFQERFGALYKKAIPYMMTTFKQIAVWALAEVRTYTPTPRAGSTSIRDLWRMTESRQAAWQEFVIANIYANQDVLVFMEEGTKPHQIKSKGTWPLHFFLDSGEEIYCRLVHHPGTVAYHMIQQTESAAQIKIEQYIHDTRVMIDKMMGSA